MVKSDQDHLSKVTGIEDHQTLKDFLEFQENIEQAHTVIKLTDGMKSGASKEVPQADSFTKQLNAIGIAEYQENKEQIKSIHDKHEKLTIQNLSNVLDAYRISHTPGDLKTLENNEQVFKMLAALFEIDKKQYVGANQVIIQSRFDYFIEHATKISKFALRENERKNSSLNNSLELHKPVLSTQEQKLDFESEAERVGVNQLKGNEIDQKRNGVVKTRPSAIEEANHAPPQVFLNSSSGNDYSSLSMQRLLMGF